MRKDAIREASFLIAAVARNGVIGSRGDIPWRLSSDLRQFRRRTMDCVLVVGRRTYDSLPPMQGRRMVVVTSRPMPRDSTAVPAASFDEAVEIALRSGAKAIAFAGGTSVYEGAMRLPWLRRAYVTSVDVQPEGDAFFPELTREWETSQEITLPNAEGEPEGFVMVLERRRTSVTSAFPPCTIMPTTDERPSGGDGT